MIEWNKVKYIDCMDEKEGLLSLPDKSIDLCLTDPPFNVKYKKKSSMDKRKVSSYDDFRLDYDLWCESWFKELERICNTIIIHCGKVNLEMWYKIKAPYDIIIWYPFSMSPSYGRACWSWRMHPFICYGKFGKRRLHKDVYPLPLKFKHKGQLIHSCPLNFQIVSKMIEELKPQSFIDPFMGSGTTAEVCIKLGIPYIGYEINPIYKHDIDLRIKKGISCIKSPRNVSYWLKKVEK